MIPISRYPTQLIFRLSSNGRSEGYHKSFWVVHPFLALSQRNSRTLKIEQKWLMKTGLYLITTFDS